MTVVGARPENVVSILSARRGLGMWMGGNGNDRGERTPFGLSPDQGYLMNVQLRRRYVPDSLSRGCSIWHTDRFGGYKFDNSVPGKKNIRG